MACSLDGRGSSPASNDLLAALEERPDSFVDNDMVVIRYEGPRGAPGMPELLDPTSRITTLCRQKNITIALMTDARFSGGSVGLVIGHVAPEAYLGGPIALIEDGDTIVVDVNTDRLDCRELDDPAVFAARSQRMAGRRAGIWRSSPRCARRDEPDVEADECYRTAGAARQRDGAGLAACSISSGCD